MYLAGNGNYVVNAGGAAAAQSFSSQRCDGQSVCPEAGDPRIRGINHPVWIGDLTAAQRETAFGNGANQLGLSILRISVDDNKNNWSKELDTAKAAVAKGAIVFASPGILLQV